MALQFHWVPEFSCPKINKTMISNDNLKNQDQQQPQQQQQHDNKVDQTNLPGHQWIWHQHLHGSGAAVRQPEKHLTMHYYIRRGTS